ncbi:MAG: 8-amino-7-oxononanoate synthase [Alphaproteobacteria bacterium]|nr:8-amino-7-oxononanoate synthase [Alphaproteobacteria bacterium]
MTTDNASQLDEFCAARLTALEKQDLRRYLATTKRQGKAQTLHKTLHRANKPPTLDETRDKITPIQTEAGAKTPPAQNATQDKALLSFSCNDYLGLAHHPAVIQAAQEAAAEYGASAGASRLVTGNHPLFTTLEAQLADLKQTQDCVVFGSGYLANIGLIPALATSRDLLLIDELAHACIYAGAQLSGAEIIRFKHNNMTELETHLAQRRAAYEKCLLLTDGVFSMDGDLAPLPQMRHLADQYNAWLITDDAHGIGVVGGGRGSSFAFQPAVKPDIQMGTLSKAVGSYGGYVCASAIVCAFLRNRARPFIYSTGLPPMSAAAAIAALQLIATDRRLTEQPLALARQFCAQIGLSEPQSPIVPIILRTAKAALQASMQLAQDGYLVTAIRPPSVPENTARLRVAFSAAHTIEQVAQFGARVKQILQTIADEKMTDEKMASDIAKPAEPVLQEK